MHVTQKVRILLGEDRGSLATVISFFGNDDAYVNVEFVSSREPATFARKFVVPAEDAFMEFWGIWHLVDFRDQKAYALCGPEITQKGPLLPDIPTPTSPACGYCQRIARGEILEEEEEDAICPTCQTSLRSELTEEYGFPGPGEHLVVCAKCKSELVVVVACTFAVRMRTNA